MAVDFDAILAKAGDKLLMVDVYTQWCAGHASLARDGALLCFLISDAPIWIF